MSGPLQQEMSHAWLVMMMGAVEDVKAPRLFAGGDKSLMGEEEDAGC